ncbi:MAG: hypothetical protein MI976_05040 [Pseudomonadales bacterium]|nr:hypothetical protein [Pseudomonadales bacterium]
MKVNSFHIQNQITFTCLFLILLVSVLSFNSGNLIFSLDDPYIHLALAENLIHGHYGVNEIEYSAPSSSVLWPYLIAPVTLLPGADWMLLLINFLCGSATVYLIGQLLQAWFGNELPRPRWAMVLLIIGFNLVGLIYTGMEHSLQVLLATAVFYGFYKTRTSGKVDNILLIALLLGPLIRYENVLMSAVFGGYLFFRQAKWQIFLVGILAIAMLLLNIFFLKSLGLGAVPSSIQSKSLYASYDVLTSVVSTFTGNLASPGGLPLVVIWCFLLKAVRSSKDSPLLTRELAWLSFIALTLHLLLGRVGWFGRYEIYCAVPAILTVIYYFRDRFLSFLNRPRKHVWLILFVSVYLLTYSVIYVGTPLSSNNVYEQQFQMHRYVTEIYRKPVAVNDLGWVSYANDEYVLDLWGLGSQESLHYRKTEDNPQWMDKMTSSYNVGLAMLYVKKYWFEEVPNEWCRVGYLQLHKPKLIIASTRVDFFVTSIGDQQYIEQTLAEFQDILPKSVDFIVTTGTESENNIRNCL